MTALTPQQMRELATDGESVSGELESYSWEDISDHPPAVLNELSAALRTAADQLDAVQDVVGRMSLSASRQALNAILTADTAPQEDRDE